MAATGKTPILLYGSTTATNVPVAGNLTNSSDGCEIAINVADKNLFFKDSTNAVNTVPIRQSSGSSDGWLSSTNWTTFNSKQTAYTNLTTIGSLANATGWLYNNGSGTFSYSTPSASDVGAVPTSRTVSTTSPLAGGGALSSNLTLSITQATTSTSGYLSSTDWTTFNNKQAALGYTPVNKSGDTMTGNLTAPVLTASSWMYVTPATATNNALYRANNTGGTIYMGLDNSAGGLSGSAYALTFYHSGNYPISFLNNGTEKLNIATTGDVNVKTGNLVIGTSGKGIDFSATAGTGTSELLADYEEGTWTPTTQGVTVNSGTPTWSGTYTKIGRMVTLTIKMTGANVTLAVATSKITNAPFTAANDTFGVFGNNGTAGSGGFLLASSTTVFFGTAGTYTTIAGCVSYFV